MIWLSLSSLYSLSGFRKIYIYISLKLLPSSGALIHEHASRSISVSGSGVPAL